MPVEPPRAEDFFEWEDEVPEAKESPRIVKIAAGVIALMLFLIVLILLGKGVLFVWNL